MTNNLPAGPELDARIATEVMGWHRDGQVENAEDSGAWANDDGLIAIVWKPSTEIAAARKVLDTSLREQRNKTLVAVMEVLGIDNTASAQQAVLAVLRHLTPLAICHAVLPPVNGTGD